MNSEKLATLLRFKWLTLLCVLAVLCLFMPLRVGDKSNSHIPVIGWAEHLTHEYCNKTLSKATAAYVSTKAVSKVLAVVSDTQVEVNVPIVGGVTLAPGKALSAASDILDRISAGLFIIICSMMIGKFLSGISVVLAIKFLIPVGTLFLFTSSFVKSFQESGEKLHFLFIKWHLSYA